LLFALLTGMVRGHAIHRRHPGPEQLWQTIQPLLPHPHAATAADPASTTAPRWPASSTCWRRLRDWQHVSVWQQLHHLFLDQLGLLVAWHWVRATSPGSAARSHTSA